MTRTKLKDIYSKDRNSNNSCGPDGKGKIPGFMNKIGG